MHTPRHTPGRRRAPAPFVLDAAPSPSQTTVNAASVAPADEAAAGAPTRRHVLRRLAVAAGSVGLGGTSALLAGCGGGTADSAYLRFCHTGIDDTKADFWVAGTRVLSGLANGGTVSSWLEGEAGSVTLGWYPSGSSTAG